MTVATQTTKVTATGNASATTFSFSPLVIYSSSDLEVVTTVISTGVETVRSEGTGASAWALGITSFPATGSITYPQDAVTPLPATETITIKRVLTLEQQTDLENQGGYFPDVQETQFDKLIMIDLQQQETLDRSITFPVSYAGSVAPTMPAPLNPGYVLKVNSLGTALEWSANSTTTSNASDVVSLAGAITGSAGTANDFAREDHVHPQTFIVGGAIASASPLVIDTDGRYFSVTGTTGFSAMTVAANRFFILEFAAALTMTHGSGTLDLPGAANITTAAGDVAICVSTAENVVTVVNYLTQANALAGVSLADDNVWTGAQRTTVTALTSTSNSIAVELNSSNDFSHTFTESTTLANPTSTAIPGQKGTFFFTQHASTPFTLAYGSEYDFVGSEAITISAVASARDSIDYVVREDGKIELTGSLAFG